MYETSSCPPWCIRDHADGPSHESSSIWVPVDQVDDSNVGHEEYLVVQTLAAGAEEPSVFIGDPDLTHGQHLEVTPVSARRIARAIYALLEDGR